MVNNMEATSGKGGKGDTYRPVDRQRFNRNYLRLYGKKCDLCNGDGVTNAFANEMSCPQCDGLGYVEK
jgi:DnaJ-class molecular chaperone